MRPRTTLALAILVLAIVAFVVFWEHERPGTREEAELAQHLLPAGLDLARVERVTIERDGVSLLLARVDGAWSLRAPLEDLASTERAERLLETLDAVEVLARLPEDELGARLGPASLRVTLDQPGAATGIEFFDLKVADSHVYARVNDEAVLGLVPARLLDELGLSVDELRREEALAFPIEEVARFELSGEDLERLAFERSGRGWRVLHPYVDEADSSRVSALLSAILALRADRFAPLDESPEEDPNTTPSLVFRAEDEEGHALPQLEIRKRSAQASARRWARVEGRPGLLRLDARALLRQLREGAESWRSLLVLDFAPSELRQLSYESPAGNLLIERSAPEVAWSAKGSATLPDQEAIAELVFQLARVEAEAPCAACESGPTEASARLVLRGFGDDGSTPPLASLEIQEMAGDATRRLVRRSEQGPLLLTPAAPFALLESMSLTVSKPRE